MTQRAMSRTISQVNLNTFALECSATSRTTFISSCQMIIFKCEECTIVVYEKLLTTSSSTLKLNWTSFKVISQEFIFEAYDAAQSMNSQMWWILLQRDCSVEKKKKTTAKYSGTLTDGSCSSLHELNWGNIYFLFLLFAKRDRDILEQNPGFHYSDLHPDKEKEQLIRCIQRKKMNPVVQMYTVV